MPSISIIVPVYHTEQYLHRCIDSILAQTYTDYELILVNDGSPDNCGLICDEYAAMDSRVRVVHKTNGGVSSARNVGLDCACGTYVMFCDSDDYVNAEWCMQHYKAAKQNPSAWIVSNIWRLRIGTGELRQQTDACPQKPHTAITYYDIFQLGLSGFPVNKIYVRSILQENKIRFDINKRIGEDVEFNVRYFQHCSSIHYIAAPLYYYCENSSSALSSYHHDWLEQHLMPFYVRVPLIGQAHLHEYCDQWLCEFIRSFDIIFDPRNSRMSLMQKLAYNHRMLNSEEFRYCLAHASCQKESELVIWLLKNHNYYLYWLCMKIIELKKRLLRRHTTR